MATNTGFVLQKKEAIKYISSAHKSEVPLLLCFCGRLMLPLERKTNILREIQVKVKRIVSNIKASNPEKAEAFYKGIFGLELVMNLGWIQTYGINSEMTPQVSIASEGGSGTPVPDLSIEVDNLETALARVKDANVAIEYGPQSEPWGVRRFYVRDPFGKLVNVLQHE